MEDATVCSGGTDSRVCGYSLPAMAAEAQAWSMVPKYGDARPNSAVLRHGSFPIDSIYGNGLYSSTWAVALSESVRGRGVL